MTAVIEPFTINVDDSVLDDLRNRLARTRYPDQIQGTGWEYGIPIDYLHELVDYWLQTYDWRAEEARLNQLEQFRTTIDGQSIHFVHSRSPNPDAFPLLLIHGWPGSIVEFQEAIPRLCLPEADGGQSADAFHVIAPSLPGYGFSEPTRTPGWDIRRIAHAFSELMSRLGYPRYGAQGGDWGAMVSSRIAVYDSAHCVGLHLNMPMGTSPSDSDALSDEEQADLADLTQFQKEESGYANEQGTKPQTVGVGLNDSPAGLLGWIVEKFRGWSDCNGDPETVFTKDQLITNVMLYWATETITSSARLYRETRHGRALAELPFVKVPTGVARFPKEILRSPRSWVEHQFNLTHWTSMPRGGHFGAMEQPELFVDDVRQFFRTVR